MLKPDIRLELSVLPYYTQPNFNPGMEYNETAIQGQM